MRRLKLYWPSLFILFNMRNYNCVCVCAHVWMCVWVWVWVCVCLGEGQGSIISSNPSSICMMWDTYEWFLMSSIVVQDAYEVRHNMRSNMISGYVVIRNAVAVRLQETKDRGKLTLAWLDSCSVGSPEGINWISSSIIPLSDYQLYLVSWQMAEFFWNPDSFE